ncbi:MAG: hypothetical protein R2697_05325 [Ilumatobacteraceae bacterium]
MNVLTVTNAAALITAALVVSRPAPATTMVPTTKRLRPPARPDDTTDDTTDTTEATDEGDDTTPTTRGDRRVLVTDTTEAGDEGDDMGMDDSMVGVEGGSGCGIPHGRTNW